MLVYVELNDRKYNAYFESFVSKEHNSYGNGIYMSIFRNKQPFAYLDCRYFVQFDEKKVLTKYLKDYYGRNLIRIRYC